MNEPTPGKGDYTRRALLVLLASAIGAAVLLSVDGAAGSFARRLQPGGDLRLGGDVRRTLEFLQQFGDVASSIIAGVCILLLDPAMRRRMLDWIAGSLATSAVVWVLKACIGRPRPAVIYGNPKPGFERAVQFTPPWETYPLPRTDSTGVRVFLDRHAWEVWKGISSDLWSMPSSHTSAAASLAVALATMYPRLRPLVWTLVGIVAVSRVLLGAHFPSDVILGAGVGYAVTTLVMGARWGQRIAARGAAKPPAAG